MPSLPLRSRRRALFGLSLLPLLPLLARPAAAIDAGAIVIGHAIDLSGPDASLGRDYVAGIRTCFDAHNAAGGIHGRRLRYLVRDDGGVPDAAAAAVADLIERERIDCLFGGIGDNQLQVLLRQPAFRRSGLTLFAPLAGTPPADAPVRFWRPDHRQEIRHLVAHFARLGVARVGIAHQPTPARQAAHRELVAELQTRRLTLAASVPLSDPAAAAARMAAARPQLVLVLADTIGTGLFLKEFRRQRAQVFVAGTSLTNLETLRQLAGTQAVEWTVFSQVVPNPQAGASPLQAEHLNMMRRFRDENVSALTLEGFAAAKTLTRALAAARQPGRAALPEWLAQGGSADLGGLPVSAAGGGSLSNYLDVALFGKGGGLVF